MTDSTETAASAAAAASAPSPTEASRQRNIAPVVLRTITGSCGNAGGRAGASSSSSSSFAAGAASGPLDWSGPAGLVAYASNILVVVVDPVTLQVAQVLDRHRSPVTRVCWTRAPTSKHPADRLTLASADSSGHVVVWNVKSGEVKAVLQEGAKPVLDMAWLDGRVENTGHLLAALHPPFSLVLWDTAAGTKVWKKTYTETLQGFDLDPFDPSRLAFRCIECILFVEDFHHARAPTSAGKKFYVSGPARGSPVRNPSGADALDSVGTTPVASTPSGDGGRAARVRIKKMMRELVMGENHSGGSGAAGAGDASYTLSECLQVKYHRAVRNHLLLVYPREVLILDLDIGQTVGIVAVDRSGPSILSTFSASQRDTLFLLTEGGSVSMRVRRKVYGVSSTPMEPIRNMSRQLAGSVPSTPAAGNNSNYLQTPGSVEDLYLGGGNVETVLEINYEQRACSDSIRLGKNARVVGMTADPISEKSMCVLSSDGRLVTLDVVADSDDDEQSSSSSAKPQLCLEDVIPPTASSCGQQQQQQHQLRLYTSGVLTGLAPPPFVIRMCPPLTMKNLGEYVPHLAVGATSGNVQLVNASTGRVEREFAIHTFPVRGIEWTGLHTILSHAHQALSGAGGGGAGHAQSSHHVRNELVHTDLRTGRSQPLRTNRSEEPPIDMLRVSHLKQYFIVAFAAAPFELWDLKTMTLLRTMPKKFPAVTALDWSPLHNLKSLRKKQQQADQQASKSDEGESTKSPPPPPPADSTLIAKEHFVFTDPEGQLYHFSVEGNAIRDGTKVPAESSLSTITYIAWKSDHIVRGDSDGNLNVWDVRTRTSRNIATNRGPVRKARFAPGKGNFKLLVLHPDAVAIWDVRECRLVNELRTPRDVVRVADVEWAASDRAVLATADGCLRIMGLSLTSSTSGMLEYNSEFAVRCHPLLPNKARANFHVLLQHQPWKEKYSLDFGEDDGFSALEAEFVSQQVHLLPEGARRLLEDPATETAARCLAAARIAGSAWEADFWTVANSVLKKKGIGGDDVGQQQHHSLDTRFDLICDSETYRSHQMERVRLHETRCRGNHAQRKKLVDLLLCLGQSDDAVRLLLDAEPENNPRYYEDALKACLVASTASTPAGTPHSTTKLVATNLIADGKLWEGVQLLCLVGKAADACKYLQSCGRWDESLWLARCRLDGQELAAAAAKYCDHCLSRDLKKRAALVRLSMGDLVGCLDALVSAKSCVPLAAAFLEACRDSGSYPDTSHALYLAEEISLAYARHLFDCGNSAGAFHYCDRADEKGEVLRREMEVLLSNSRIAEEEEEETKE